MRTRYTLRRNSANTFGGLILPIANCKVQVEGSKQQQTLNPHPNNNTSTIQ